MIAKNSLKVVSKIVNNFIACKNFFILSDELKKCIIYAAFILQREAGSAGVSPASSRTQGPALVSPAIGFSGKIYFCSRFILQRLIYIRHVFWTGALQNQ